MQRPDAVDREVGRKRSSPELLGKAVPAREFEERIAAVDTGDPRVQQR